jgi:hypothetical protein
MASRAVMIHQSDQYLVSAEHENVHDPDLMVHAVTELIEMAPCESVWILSRALDAAISRLL